MKIYSNRADKNVDCIRTSMRTEKHNSLHVTLNFRRTVGGPVTMEEETGSEVIINFTDTCELDNFIMALTQLKEMTKGYQVIKEILDNTPKKPKTGAGCLRTKRGNINER